MTFTFVHTSDWHIGKPFGRFPPDQSAVLRRARLLAIDRLAEIARMSGASHVLVAGDMFDRPGIPDKDLQAPLRQMRIYGDLTWHVIPGNHDPAVSGGAWERAVRASLPENLRLYLDPCPVEIAPSCILLPAPLSARAMSSDPTGWMDAAPTAPGAFRIGLAHGSIQGFGGEKDASISIATDRAKRSGLSYLALGDWHGHLQVGPATAYSGTPEPDAFLDNSAGGALVVVLKGAADPPRITRHETAQHRWHKSLIETSRSSDLTALESLIEGWGASARNTLLSLEVRGRASPAEELELMTALERMEPRLFHLERNLADLKIIAGAEDLACLEEGPLRNIALELSALSSRGTPAEAAVAARALRHLFDLAQLSRGDAA